MQLEILTPEKSVFKGEVNSIQLPGSEGLLGILNHHAPILTSIQSGTIKYEWDGKETFLFISKDMIP